MFFVNVVFELFERKAMHHHYEIMQEVISRPHNVQQIRNLNKELTLVISCFTIICRLLDSNQQNHDGIMSKVFLDPKRAKFLKSQENLALANKRHKESA